MISVLYVDDEAGLLGIAKLFLEKTGLFSVDTVTSGQDALEKIASGHYDAVVSDYKMPGMDGIELLVSVRDRYPSLPFIIFTGKGREEIAIEAFEKGADFYLQKGGEPKAQFAELAHKIQAAVNQRESDRVIREAEDKYRQIVETAQEGILTVDADERITFVNKTLADLVGLSADEIIGRRVTDFISPEEIGLHEEELARRRQGKAGTYEHHVRLPAGREIWVKISGTPLTDREGRYAGAFDMLTDITERKRTLERLSASELRYRQLFNSLKSGVAIFEALDDGRDFVFRDINRAVEQIEGLSRDGVLGRRLTDVFPGVGDFGLLPVLRRVWRTGVPEHPPVSLYEDGRIRGWRDNFVYRLPEGEVIAVYDDVTAMKEATNALLEREQRFRALISNSSDIIRIIGPDGRITFDPPSSERILGYPEGFSVGKSPVEFIHPDDRTRVLAELTKVYAGSNAGSPTEFRVRKADGTYLAVESVAKNLIGTPGINGIVVTTRPIQERKDAERAILEGEERYRRIVETAQEGIIGIDADSRITFVNKKTVDLVGLPPDEIIGRPVADLISPDEEEAHDAEIARRRQGKTGTYERRIRTAAGGDVWVRVSATPLTGADGSYTGAFAMLTDITERKRIQKVLEEREETYRTLVERAGDGITIIQDGIVKFCNARLAAMWGGPVGEVIGRPFIDFVHPDSLPAIRERYHKRMAGLELGIFTATLLRMDGSAVYAELNGGLVTHQGSPADLVVVRDVTERRRAEIELQESENRYRNVVEDQTEFICRFIPGGVHVFVNDAYCRYFGKTRAGLIGHRFVPKIPPEDAPVLRDHFVSLSPGSPVATVEHRIVMPDGSTRWQRWSDRAIFDGAGKVVEYQSVGRDVTEKKEAEIALHRANMKLNLLSGVTRHDILNKVTVLLGHAQLARDTVVDPLILSSLDKIEDAARVIRAQISFTRDYQDLGVENPVWLNIGSVAERAWGDLQPGGMKFQVSGGGWEVLSDPLLERVFYNLFDNAIRHGNTVTTITVQTGEKENRLVVAVSDNGSGVPEDEKERIFERGYGKATGLGLFLAREILSITGMTIVETGIPGTGARFEITVPPGMFRNAPGG